MTTRWVGVVVVGVLACGPSKGGSTDESSGAVTETGDTPTSGAGTTSVGTEPTTDATTGALFDSSCDAFFGNRDAVAGIVVSYRYGNHTGSDTQGELSELQIFVDGSIYHNESMCCPVDETNMPETTLDAATLTALKAQADAVLAGGSMTEDLGPMMVDQRTGIMCVLVNGQVGTVRAFEPGVDSVVKRFSTAPEAADIAALVHKYTKLDMPE